LGYEYVGEQTVKNINKPVRVYKVHLEPGTATTSTVKAAPHAPSPLEKKAALRRWLRVALAVVGVLVVGAGVAVLRNVYQRPSSPLSAVPSAGAPALSLPDTPSVAVLPFTNMSDDPEQEYFSDGMTDDLITDLSRLSGLLVIARHSVFAYKGKAVNMKEVSRELGVRYVLEGSVRRAGEQVRINAQLIDATSGYHLWAERPEEAIGLMKKAMRLNPHYPQYQSWYTYALAFMTWGVTTRDEKGEGEG
jgi:TolB-like protein